uniref:3-hydroxyacyl-CoA dehydrogenase type-2-like n=1 Tax=Phallusia mammillata TaxID=59560 RepID=A0A6F9DEQ5_9ASCI|nr:3-hydroxyacyl-CoA dehydrogenase type-2-like [Phallusia mammillata]
MRGLVALVTGAAGSLGKATVEKFLADGIKVVAFDKRVFTESSKFCKKDFQVFSYTESAAEFFRKQTVWTEKKTKEPQNAFSTLFDSFSNEQFTGSKKKIPKSDFYDEQQINRDKLFADEEPQTQKPELESLTTNNETYFVGQSADNCIEVNGDVLSTEDVVKALDSAKEMWGQLHIVVNCAAVGSSVLIYNQFADRSMGVEIFEDVINTNTKGTFNVIRLAAERMTGNDNIDSFGRGVIINTSSSFSDSKSGSAYSASCSGVDAMTLPIARDLASHAIRVVTVAPGLFESDLISTRPPQNVLRFLSQLNVFPKRLGKGEDYAHLVSAIVNNQMLNGLTVKLDAGLRFPF